MKTSLFKRTVYAFGTDTVFIYLLNKAVLFTYINYINNFFLFDMVIPQEKINNYLDNLSPIILLSLFTSIFCISYFISNGQTLGKIIFGLRIQPINNTKELDLLYCLFLISGHYMGIITLGLSHIPIFNKRTKSLAQIIFRYTIVDVYSEIEEKNVYQLSTKRYNLELRVRK